MLSADQAMASMASFGEGKQFSGEMMMEYEQIESSSAGFASAEERDAKMAEAVANASKRYEKWEAELKSVGQKESELFTSQWKLIGEEMGLLSRDLAAVKFGLEEMRMSSRSAMARMRMSFAEKEESGKKEEEQRQQLEDSLRDEIKQLRADLQKEIQMREEGDAKNLAGATDKADQALRELQTMQSKDLPAMRDGLNNMRSTISRTGPQIDGLKDSISMETRAREMAQESLMKTLRDHRDALSVDIRKAHMAIEPHKQELRRIGDALEQERSDRDLAIAPLHERIGGVERSIEEPQKLEQKMDLPSLREVAHGQKARHDEHKAALEQVNQGLATALTRLDKQLAELTARTESESAARRALKGELEESLAATTAQVRTLATEHTEVSKSQRETMERFVNEHTTRVATSHTSHQEKLQKAVTSLKEDLTARLNKMEQGQKELTQQQREVATPVASSRSLFEGSSPDKKQHDDLARQVRDLQRRMPEAQSASETIVYPHEDHILYLQDSLQEFCERFLGGLSRRRSTLESRTVMVQSVIAGDSITFEAGAGFAMESSAQSAAQSGYEVIATTGSTKSATQTGTEVIKAKEAPELTTDQSQQLQQVLASKRVELVMNTGPESQGESGALAQVKLKETIHFKPVHHGDSPTAEFKDQAKVLDILGDVAAIMKLYSTAVLLIEGHTATPPERMDQWAHDLASNRAQKVKVALEGLGLDSGRLRSVGLPGNLGSGKIDTVLKITSF